MKILKWILGLAAGLSGVIALFAGGKSKQKVKEIKKNIVKVQLLGNCAECTVNQMTLKQGVELTIKKHAPSIQKVINVE